MKRLRDPGLLKWLEGAPEGSHFTGFDAAGWETSVWILHAMYENENLPDGITHDDLHRMERSAGAIEPKMVGGVDLEEVLADAKVVGSALGRSGWPGPGWQRLTWRDLAHRLEIDPFAIDVPPCSRSFPYSSWPASIAPPGEGSLDREQFFRLLDRLAATTPAGQKASCVAFYAMSMVGEFEEPVLYEGTLRQLIELYDADIVPGSPSNFWPDDKSWLVYTDGDLWATKVNGSADLIDCIISDEELESITLPF